MVPNWKTKFMTAEDALVALSQNDYPVFNSDSSSNDIHESYRDISINCTCNEKSM